MKKVCCIFFLILTFYVSDCYAQKNHNNMLRTIEFHVVYIKEIENSGKYKTIGTDIWEADDKNNKRKEKVIIEIYILDGQVVQIANFNVCKNQ